MKIGIGLPASLPHTHADLIQEWARQADAGLFSSLGSSVKAAPDHKAPSVQHD